MLLELGAHATERIATSTVARIPETLDQILGRLGTRLGIDRTTVCSLSPDRQGFVAVATWSAPEVPRLKVAESHASGSSLVRTVLRGETVRIEHMQPELLEGADRWIFSRNEQRSLLALPLRASGGTVGLHTLSGIRRSFRWSRRLVRALDTVGSVLALALERMLLHDRLTQERKAHEDTQRIAGVGHWQHTFTTGSSQGSPQLYRMLNLDERAEFEPRTMLERADPSDREALRQHLDALMDGRPSSPVEYRLRLPDGDRRWVRAWGELSTRSDGSAALAHGVVHDVTRSKQAEQAIEATSGRLVRAQEEERARLGRELHDDLGQRVAALAISVGSLEAKARTEGSAMVPLLCGASEQLGELSTIVRSLSHSLYPQELRRLGLDRALESLCQRTSMLTEVDVALTAGAMPGHIPEPTTLALYRVAQEALANAVRHGQAREIAIEVTASDGEVRLSVIDDGVGFEPDALGDAGLGLLGMQERMRLCQGVLRVRSSAEGTIIEARAPLRAGSDRGGHPG